MIAWPLAQLSWFSGRCQFQYIRLRLTNVGEEQHDCPGDEKCHERKDRVTVRTSRRDNQSENLRPDPRGAALADVLYPEVGRLLTSRDQPRKQLPRKCLGATEDHSDGRTHAKCLGRGVQEGVCVHHDGAPDNKAGEDRIFRTNAAG